MEKLFFCYIQTNFFFKCSSQQVWRVATEILHQHSNSTMEDYNQVYELIKLSVVKDYVMVSLPAGPLTALGGFTLTLVLVGSSRLV